MVDDPAIRSVRVAAVLCDRFAELLKGPTIVTAHKGRGALIGVKGNEDELSLRLGEAQQIYPEIWSHLDEARKAFGERGVNLAAFDQLREIERQYVGTGAAVQDKFTQYGDPMYGMQERIKKATFNEVGLARARNAIMAIQNATPNINWAAIAKAEDNDPHAAAFRRATLIKRIWMFGLLIAVLGIPFWWIMWKRHEENVKREKWRQQSEQRSYQPPPPAPPPANALPAAEQQALRAQATKIRDELVAVRDAWPTIMADENLRKHKPGAEPCPVPVTAPSKEAADAYIKDGILDEKAFAASAFYGYLTSEGLPPISAIAETIRTANVAIVNFKDGYGTPDTRQELDALEKPLVFAMIDSDDEPRVTSVEPKLEMVPGKVAARAYVLDVRSAKIVCAGAFVVKGSDAKAAGPLLAGAANPQYAEHTLHQELEVRIREALASSLKAVAP